MLKEKREKSAIGYLIDAVTLKTQNKRVHISFLFLHQSINPLAFVRFLFLLKFSSKTAFSKLCL